MQSQTWFATLGEVFIEPFGLVNDQQDGSDRCLVASHFHNHQDWNVQKLLYYRCHWDSSEDFLLTCN